MRRKWKENLFYSNKVSFDLLHTFSDIDADTTTKFNHIGERAIERSLKNFNSKFKVEKKLKQDETNITCSALFAKPVS